MSKTAALNQWNILEINPYSVKLLVNAMNIKYITVSLKYTFFILTLITFSFTANSESSVEEIIKERKAIFSKNYSTAKKVQTLASKGDFEKAKKLMFEMSKNYKNLLEYFPKNTMEGFKT